MGNEGTRRGGVGAGIPTCMLATASDMGRFVELHLVIWPSPGGVTVDGPAQITM